MQQISNFIKMYVSSQMLPTYIDWGKVMLVFFSPGGMEEMEI